MEMFVRSLEAQTVTLRDLGLTVEFDEGETLRTEISTKFTREGVEAELAAAGLGSGLVDGRGGRLRAMPREAGVARGRGAP